MKKNTITLSNDKIAQAISRLYPEDYCVILWGEDMEVHRFTDKKEAEVFAEERLQILESDVFVLLFKNGGHFE